MCVYIFQICTDSFVSSQLTFIWSFTLYFDSTLCHWFACDAAKNCTEKGIHYFLSNWYSFWSFINTNHNLFSSTIMYEIYIVELSYSPRRRRHVSVSVQMLKFAYHPKYFLCPLLYCFNNLHTSLPTWQHPINKSRHLYQAFCKNNGPFFT
jgi:hypothetical protein